MKSLNLHTITLEARDNTIGELFQEFAKLFTNAGHTVHVNRSVENPDIIFTNDKILVQDDGILKEVSTAAFDVQGTLLGPNSDTIVRLLKYTKKIGIETIVWTGGDTSDSIRAAKRLGIESYVDEYDNKFRDKIPDIAFDDDENAMLLGTIATIRI